MNKTLASLFIAGTCLAGAMQAEARPHHNTHHHHHDRTAERIGAVGGIIHAGAEVLGVLTGQPRVVAPVVAPAPVVAAPVVAAPVVAAPVVATPVVAPAPVVAAPVVTPVAAPVMGPVKSVTVKGIDSTGIRLRTVRYR